MKTAELTAPALGTVSRPFHDLAVVIEDVAGIANLRAEIAALQQENARLKAWYQTAMMLETENKSLQELLNVKLDPRYSFVTARVITDPSSSFVHSIIVNAGENDAVQKGQAVLSGDGLVGRIVEVDKNVARVLLLNDMNARIPVMIAESRHKAIMTGTNRKQPVLNYLSGDVAIEAGARVVTSGDGGVLPPGLPVGVVKKGADERTYVDLFSDADRLMHVRIVNVPVDPYLQTSLSE